MRHVLDRTACAPHLGPVRSARRSFVVAAAASERLPGADRRERVRPFGGRARRRRQRRGVGTYAAAEGLSPDEARERLEELLAGGGDVDGGGGLGGGEGEGSGGESDR